MKSNVTCNIYTQMIWNIFHLLLGLFSFISSAKAAAIRYDFAKTQYYFANYTQGCNDTALQIFNYDMIDVTARWIREVNKNLDRCSVNGYPMNFELPLPDINKNVRVIQYVDDECVFTSSWGKKTKLNEEGVGGIILQLFDYEEYDDKGDTMYFHLNLPLRAPYNIYPPAYASPTHGLLGIHTNIYLYDIVQTIMHEFGHLLGYGHTENGIVKGEFIPNPMIVSNISFCYVTPHLHGVGMSLPQTVHDLGHYIGKPKTILAYPLLREDPAGLVKYEPDPKGRIKLQTSKESGMMIETGRFSMLIGDNEDLYINLRAWSEYPSVYRSDFRYRHRCVFENGDEILDCDIGRYDNIKRVYPIGEHTVIYEFLSPEQDIFLYNVTISSTNYTVHMSYINKNHFTIELL